MAENNEPKTKCISVFKSGESTTTERKFTDKWIELINTIEKEAKVQTFAKKRG